MPKLFYTDAEKAEKDRLFYNKDGSPKILSVSDRDKQRLQGDLKRVAILQEKHQAIIALNNKIQNNFDEYYLPAFQQSNRFGNDFFRQKENSLIVNPIAELNFNVKIFNEAIQQRNTFLKKLSEMQGAQLARIAALTKTDREANASYQEILKRQAALQRTIDEEYLPEFLNNPLYRKSVPNRPASAKIISLELKINADIKELNEKIQQLQARVPSVIKNTIQVLCNGDKTIQRHLTPTRDNVMQVYRGQVDSIRPLSRTSLKFKKDQLIVNIYAEISHQHRKVKDNKSKLEESLKKYYQYLADEEKVLQAQQKAIRNKDSNPRDKAQHDFECVIENKSQVICLIEEHLNKNKQDIDVLNEKIKKMNKCAKTIASAQLAAAKSHTNSTNDSTSKIFTDLLKSPGKKFNKQLANKGKRKLDLGPGDNRTAHRFKD